MSRIIIEVYDSVPKSTRRNIVTMLQDMAEENGWYAHTHIDKFTGDTRVDVTRSSRKFVDIGGFAAEYLLDAAKERGISVEQLIKETVGAINNE